jgi:hypothetical protein
MIFGMSLFAFVHTLISLAGIASGFVVLCGLLSANPLDGWTSLFLWTTAATCVTGFFFPFHGFRPSYVVGALTLIVLALAYVARYRHQYAGAWRKTYVISTVIALYFNFFVLIVQSFMKVPALNALAPTQSEPPFKMAQLAALIFFVVLGVVSVKNYHPD